MGIEQLIQLADAMVAADRRMITADCPPKPRCFGLAGTLGVGKTRFCQEIARALGIDPAEVTSPTFTLLKSYVCNEGEEAANALAWTPRQLHHLDLYRVADEDELWELALDELWETPGTWVLIEWADRFMDSLPDDVIWIRMSMSPADSDCEEPLREIEIVCHTSEQSAWLAEVRAQFDRSAKRER